jgi:hypothetical protein
MISAGASLPRDFPGREGDAPSLIDRPIDYRGNEKLSEASGEVICQG